MNRLKLQLSILLVAVSMVALPVCAEEGAWKQYFDVGTKTLHYKEIEAKLEKAPKALDDAFLESTMYSISSRDAIKKSGKYLRAVLTIFRKGEQSLPTKEELSDLCGGLAIVWRDELKEAQEQTLNKSKPEKLKAIKNVQIKMQYDHVVLLELEKKVNGVSDPAYIKLKNAGERLDKSIREHS